MIVVDTNVIAYFLIPGDTTPLAESVRDKDSSWAAPRLWRSEMRNLLALYMKRAIMDLAETTIHMDNSEKLLAGREYDVLSKPILELADKSGCTAYDCEFVSLAERLGVPLITSDKKLIAAFPTIAISMKDFASS